MIHHRVIQGSQEWLRLRMGKPTASEFDRIITAVKAEPTKGEARRKYMLTLLCELILDAPRDQITTAAMDHGHEWESKARAAYEMMEGREVELCGFCTDEDGEYGASPDGFVGEEGAIEIKSPDKPEIHCGYLMDPKTLVAAYRVQTQGQLYVTGRKWTDLISYFGGMPMVTVRVEPDPEFQVKLAEALRLFCIELALYVDIAKERGWIKPPRPEADHSRDFLSEADVEAILDAQREGK